jgi:hypothetical protein
MSERRFVLIDFRYTSDVMDHVRFYEAGNTYDMPSALAHAAARRELVAIERPVDWEPPSILRPPEVLDHETRRKIIRQFPKYERQTAEQAAILAKKAVEQNKFQRSNREPYDRIMGWLSSRVAGRDRPSARRSDKLRNGGAKGTGQKIMPRGVRP